MNQVTDGYPQYQATRSSPSVFQRLLLPGLAFKAAVIGGGYATGRELAEFFLPSGPRGGLLAMALATIIWSVICSLTFQLAFVRGSFDYRSFFHSLLGRFWIAFEVVYLVYIVVLLSVFGAAAGAIGAATLGWPSIAGTLCLMACITLFAAFGNQSVDRLFKYVSFFLYGTYALFLVLAVSRFGARIVEHLAMAVPTNGWVTGGITYASYNVVGAVIILPATRHLSSRRDAVVAGVIAGPLAMAPAMIFFLCMGAFYPEIQSAVLPSNFMLERIGLPLFQLAFQGMIFAALLECGTGVVHAINERIAVVHRKRTGLDLSRTMRSMIILAVLIVSIFVANSFGLVALIAKGYRMLAYLILAVYIVPLFIVAPRLLRVQSPRHGGAPARSKRF
jgi:uncharacterized membrane protein YkvI